MICRKKHPDQEICVVSHLEQYIEKIKDLEKDQNLLTKIAKTKTSSQAQANEDVTMFGSHLTKSASTVHCKRKRLFMEKVHKANI